MHLLMPLQFTRDGESHLASLISALIRGQHCVLFAHVGFQLLVFLELQATAFNFADVFLVLLGVHAADVSGPV